MILCYTEWLKIITYYFYAKTWRVGFLLLLKLKLHYNNVPVPKFCKFQNRNYFVKNYCIWCKNTKFEIQ